jgi:hypothetical protein
MGVHERVQYGGLGEMDCVAGIPSTPADAIEYAENYWSIGHVLG